MAQAADTGPGVVWRGTYPRGRPVRWLGLRTGQQPIARACWHHVNMEGEPAGVLGTVATRRVAHAMSFERSAFRFSQNIIDSQNTHELTAKERELQNGDNS